MKTPETLKQKLESHIAFLSAGRSEEEIRAAFEDIVEAVCDEMIGVEKNYVFTMSSRENFNVAMGRRERIAEEKLTKQRLLDEIKN